MIFFPFDAERYSAMVFFDVETSGLDYQCGQITQFAARKVLRDGTTSEANWYVQVKSETEYSEEVQKITKLSKEFLLENGMQEDVLAKEVFDCMFSAQPVVY